MLPLLKNIACGLDIIIAQVNLRGEIESVYVLDLGKPLLLS
jgi:hypothetical protein